MSSDNHRYPYNSKEQAPHRRALRNEGTSAEATLWLSLKGKQIEGMRWRRQFGVGPYILDFYCPQLRLCIELDGHHIIQYKAVRMILNAMSGCYVHMAYTPYVSKTRISLFTMKQ